MSPTSPRKRARRHSLRDSISSIGDILCRSTQAANRDARILAGLGTAMKRVPDEPERPSTSENECPRSFTVFRTRMYTKDKDGWDSYHYAEVRLPGNTIPQIKISPPDNQPFQMVIEEEEEGERMDCDEKVTAPTYTAPAIPHRSPLRLTLDTKSFMEKPLPPLPARSPPPGEDLPPSPPMTPPSQEGVIIIELSEMDISTPPARIPPPPPPPRRKRKAQHPPSPPLTPVSPESLPDFFLPPARRPPPPPPSVSFLSLPPSVLLQIFVHLDSPQQMLKLSLAHPHLHKLFELHSLPIFKESRMLYSPMLHQLISIHSSSEENYFAAYLSCTGTIDKLMELIRQHCRYFLSPKLLVPSSSADEEAFSEALSTIWCFGILFSSTAQKLEPQLAWLRKQGFGKEELRMLQEVYTCLYVLLRPLTTSTQMATEVGVVRDRDIDDKWKTVEEVERWGWWVLSRGLDIVERLAEVDDDEEERWDRVVEEGLDEWDSEDAGREAAFLREAVGKMYREKCEEEGFAGPTVVEGPWGPSNEV